MKRTALLLSVLAVLLAACAGDGDGDEEAAQPRTTTARAADTSGRQQGCRRVQAPPGKFNVDEKPPSDELDADKDYTVVVETNCGTFRISLDVETSPKTTASFVSLVRAGFFDNTTFHRIVPGFVIQGGDPTGTGEGGPGYETVDRPPADVVYSKGVVGMAKTGAQAPGTAGSQFFVVTRADAGLPPDYAVLGEVIDGLSVVERIDKLGDPATDRPTQPVVIERMTVDVS